MIFSILDWLIQRAFFWVIPVTSWVILHDIQTVDGKTTYWGSFWWLWAVAVFFEIISRTLPPPLPPPPPEPPTRDDVPLC